MINGIDEISCMSCGLCDAVCQTDVFRSTGGRVYVQYPEDCYNCLECLYICPTDAILFAPGIPKKFDVRLRWQQIKDALKAR